MKKGLKIVLIVAGGLVMILGGGVIIFVSIPYESDFGTFFAMRSDTLRINEEKQLVPLPITG